MIEAGSPVSKQTLEKAAGGDEAMFNKLIGARAGHVPAGRKFNTAQAKEEQEPASTV